MPPLKPNSFIGVDFDGTCVTHEFPKVGRDIGAAPVLRELVNRGHRLILFTMRSDGRADGSNPLTDALNWFKENNIPLFGINHNPEQDSWTTSPKAYANLYIDDVALGAPLCRGLAGEKPFINWDVVRNLLLPPPEEPPTTILPRAVHITTDRNDPRVKPYTGPEQPGPQNEAYLVLSEEERAKGFVRKVRQSYLHQKCGTVTTMGLALAETYARDPKFYGATYCCGCCAHFPVAEFLWDGTQEPGGS